MMQVVQVSPQVAIGIGFVDNLSRGFKRTVKRGWVLYFLFCCVLILDNSFNPGD